MKKINLIFGTRPNFIKAFPVYESLKKYFELTLIHTGQHFDEKMSDIFFDELCFPKPDIHFDLTSNSKAGDIDTKLYVENIEYLKNIENVIIELINYDGDKLGQLGEIRDKLYNYFQKNKPDLVIVFGDVTSTLAASLACKKLNIKIAHVESGLRSRDLSMPEEVNRILTDNMSSFFFVTEKAGVDNLQKEGITENVFLVGNTMIDTQKKYLDKALNTKYNEKINVTEKEYILITLHRPSNVDNLLKLKEIFDDLFELSKTEKLVYIFHPRTKTNLEKIEYLELIKKNDNIQLEEPLGYLEFMCLMANCKYLITDSGGLQEESTSLNIPCFTLRENTERPVTLIENQGTNQIIHKISKIKLKECKGNVDLWDGKSSDRITKILKNNFYKNILICFGTRPEYIKVKSLIDNLKNIKTCFTGQHNDLLKNIDVDYKLSMEKELSENRLNNIFSNILSYNIFDDIDYVMVQGDTSTACAIALSAFNYGKKIIHLEAGLRSGDLKDPYPEEMNRQVIGRLADIHLCPTEFNKENLLKENVSGKIYVVGNTGLDNISKEGCEYNNQVLITMHRRDNHHNIDKWFQELEKLANIYSEIEFMIPLHRNPNVQKHKDIFKKVRVVEPMDHSDLIEYVKKCKFVISDSGGLQEECSYLNKKIIVCRKTTERPESIGTHSFMCEEPKLLENLVDEINKNYYVNSECPYGNGESWKKICELSQLKRKISNKNALSKFLKYINNFKNFDKAYVYDFTKGKGGIGDYLKFFMIMLKECMLNNIKIYHKINNLEIEKYIKLKYNFLYITEDEILKLENFIIKKPEDYYNNCVYDGDLNLNEVFYFDDIIKKNIKNIIPSLPTNYISIHLRLGDKFLETDKDFICCIDDTRPFSEEKLYKLIEDNNDKNILFFSDNNNERLKIKNKYKNIYKNIIITNSEICHTSLFNSTNKQILDTITDFYILCNSELIYGASNSGFSIIASKFNNIKYIC